MMKKMFALVLMLCLFALPAFAMADPQPVKYVNREWDGSRVVESKKTAAASAIENEMTDLTGGWYVVMDDVTVSERMIVADNAQVHLILADGCLLTANKGIKVPEGSSLTIYAQSSDEGTMGKLVATGGKISSNYCAGIGGGSEENCGDITINGGNVEARGAYATIGSHKDQTGAGIGAGGSQYTAQSFSSIVINGGIVNAYAMQRGSSAIGTSNRGGTGNRIEINGGTVLAYAHYQGAVGAHDADVMVRGGTLTSYGNASICVDEGDITISDAEIIPYNAHYDTATIRNYDKNGTISISHSVVKVPVAGSGTVNVTNSILFERVNVGGQGYYHGYLSDDAKSFTLEDDLIIEEKETLHVREGETLTIPEGVTLKVIGDMVVTGTIVENDTLDCSEANTHPAKEYSVTSSVAGGPDDTLKFTCYCGKTQSYTLHVPQKVYDGISERATYTVSPEGALLFGTPNYLGSYRNAGSHTATLTVAGRSLTREFTIEKAIPAPVTFPTASPIVYGQKLSASVLSGGTEGITFEWTNKNTVPPITNSGYSVRYKPEDTKNYDYSSIEGWDGSQYVVRNVAIAVSKAVPQSSDFDFFEPEPDDEDEYELFYDGTKKSAFVEPDIDAKGMGEITLIYCDEQGNESLDAPVNAGMYTVKINVAEGENYTAAEGVTGRWWKFTIYQIDPTYALPENLTATYGDTLSDVALPTEANGTWSWENGDALVGDVGQHTHTATFTPNDTQNYNTITGVELSVMVQKAAPIVTAPTANTLTYTGSAQTLIAAGSTSGGTLVYSLDGENFDPTLPTAEKAGDYTVYFKVVGDHNYLDTEPETLTAQIAKAEKEIPSACYAQYGDTLSMLALPELWSWENPNAPVGDVGERIHLASFAGDANYLPAEHVGVTVYVEKVSPDVVLPTANELTYTGEPQALITPNPVIGGVLHYSLDNVNFSADIPMGTDAGNYLVYCKFIPDANHKDDTVGNVDVIIERAEPVITAPTANTLTYTGSAQQLIAAGAAVGGEMLYSLDGETYSVDIPVATAANAYTVYYKVVGDQNHNDVAAQTVTAIIHSTETAMTASTDRDAYTYGDTITVTGTATVPQPEQRTLAFMRSFAAPTAQQVALYDAAGSQLTDPVDVVNGAYTLRHDTKDKALLPAKEMALTVRFVGDTNMKDRAVSTNAFTLSKKTIEPNLNGAASKVYDGTTVLADASGLSVALSGVLEGDKVAFAVADFTYVDANVGEGKTLVASGIALTEGENDNAFYALTATTAENQQGTISKADGTASVTLAGWTYGETANTPVLTSETNGTENVTLLYESTDGKGYVSAVVPVNAGSYKLTATFAATQNYTEAKAAVEFAIGKAAMPAPTGLTAVYGKKLSDVNLPEGWTWVTPDAAVGSAGENTHKANYMGDENHLPAENVGVVVTVAQSQTSMTAELMDNKSEYTYGEHVTIAVTPTAAGAPATFSLRRLAAPAAGQVALYSGSEQITEPQTAGSGETVTFVLDTVADGLLPDDYTLTAKYTATGDMAAQEATVSFSVDYLPEEDVPDAEIPGDGIGGEGEEPNEDGWLDEDPTLTAPEDTQISLDPTVWPEEGENGNSITLATEDGEHEITYYVKTEDGTIAEKTVTVKIDKTAPEVEEPTVLADPTKAEITIPATDKTSGVADVEIEQTGGAGKVEITDNGDGSFTVSGMTPGETYTFTATVTDKAGNVTTVKFTVTAAQQPSLPQTGDDSLFIPWLILLLMAGVGMFTLRRKAHN